MQLSRKQPFQGWWCLVDGEHVYLRYQTHAYAREADIQVPSSSPSKAGGAQLPADMSIYIVRRMHVQGRGSYRFPQSSPSEAGGAWLTACLAPVPCTCRPAVVVNACKLIAAAHKELPWLLRIDVDGVQIHALHVVTPMRTPSRQKAGACASTTLPCSCPLKRSHISGSDLIHV